MALRLAPAFTMAAAFSYWIVTAIHNSAPLPPIVHPPAVTISEPLQVLLYGGDRFLASDIETIRATAAATAPGAKDFRLRSHVAASRLNPCHGDNYWVGNSALSWGGSVKQGFELLRNASHCRYWDEWPPFFYAFNQSFFRDNVKEAQRALEIAAQRSSDNAAAFRTFSTMLGVGKIQNTRMAIQMLQEERDKAKDKKLYHMLDMRVVRLQGLLTLRKAQISYEKRFGKRLKQPHELISSGILDNFPQDPLDIGYEFHDHGFHLKEAKINQ